MGHHDWVSKEVNETDEVRWVERDTMDKTGTHQLSNTDDAFARRAAIPGNLSDVHLGSTSLRASFQSPHLTENT